MVYHGPYPMHLVPVPVGQICRACLWFYLFFISRARATYASDWFVTFLFTSMFCVAYSACLSADLDVHNAEDQAKDEPHYNRCDQHQIHLRGSDMSYRGQWSMFDRWTTLCVSLLRVKMRMCWFALCSLGERDWGGQGV